jgi:hypothetical protein
MILAMEAFSTRSSCPNFGYLGFKSGRFVRSEAPQRAGALWHLLTIIQIKWLVILLCAVGILWRGARVFEKVRFDPVRNNFSMQKAQKNTEDDFMNLQGRCLHVLDRLTNPYLTRLSP